MMSVRAIPALALAALLSVAWPVQAQLQNPDESTPTKLYFHIFDTLNAFPINTQPMDADFFRVGGTSFPTASNTIVSQQAGDYDFNTIRGFSTSGPVEYDFIENGLPRHHPERGIAADVRIDPSVQPVAYLYLDVRDFFSSDTHPQNVTCTQACVGPANQVLNPIMDEWGGAPQALPAFTFRFMMRSGNQLGDDAALDTGQAIMHGQLTAHVVDTHAVGQNGFFAGQVAPDGHPIFVSDESGVVEFAIPLAVDSETITKADSFNVRVDWYQNPSGDASNDDTAAEGWMRLVSDPLHLPRLEMAITNPVYIEYIHPEVAAGILLIHSCVNSPWGTYDVNVANITVTVDGPSEPETLQQVISQNAHVHGLHDKCAEVTYLWRFREEGAANGDYAISLGVPNLAMNAQADGDAGFTIEGKKAYGVDEAGNVIEPRAGDEGKESPLPAAPLAAAALLALAALLRRRAA